MSTFVYFVDPDRLNVTVHGLKTIDGTRRRVPLRRKLVDNPGYQNDYLPLEERKMRLPRDSMRLSDHAVHILYSTSIWAENFGHTLVDDMSPLFALMHVFKLVTRDAMILSLHGPAGTVRNQPVELARVEKFTADFVALLSDAGVHAMDSHVLFSKGRGKKQRRREEGKPRPLPLPELTCMRNLLVGSGNVENLNPDTYLVGAWTPFIDTLLDGWRRGVLLETPEEISQFVALQQQEQSLPIRPLVVFLLKIGRRRITNIDVLARETKKTFNNIEVLLINPGNMTQHDQITLAQRATVTFAPCGGTSFFIAFLREGATAIITDYWDVELNQSASMEGYFWTHVTRQQTVRYPVFQNEITPEFGQELNRQNMAEAYRNYGVLTIDIDRALHLIGHALYAGERVFDMK
jgi:hypothetical protein